MTAKRFVARTETTTCTVPRHSGQVFGHGQPYERPIEDQDGSVASLELIAAPSQKASQGCLKPRPDRPRQNHILVIGA